MDFALRQKLEVHMSKKHIITEEKSNQIKHELNKLTFTSTPLCHY